MSSPLQMFGRQGRRFSPPRWDFEKRPLCDPNGRIASAWRTVTANPVDQDLPDRRHQQEQLGLSGLTWASTACMSGAAGRWASKAPAVLPHALELLKQRGRETLAGIRALRLPGGWAIPGRERPNHSFAHPAGVDSHHPNKR